MRYEVERDNGNGLAISDARGVYLCPDFRLHRAPRHRRALRAAASVPAGRRWEPQRLHKAVWYIPFSAGHNCPPFSYQVSSCNFLITYLFISFGVLHFLFVLKLCLLKSRKDWAFWIWIYKKIDLSSMAMMFSLASCLSCSFWPSFLFFFSDYMRFIDLIFWELSAVKLGTFWGDNWELLVFPLLNYLAFTESCISVTFVFLSNCVLRFISCSVLPVFVTISFVHHNSPGTQIMSEHFE